MTLLVVEDDARVADFLSRGLRAEGYRVQTLRSGEEALALARQVAPELILLDVMLPDISGYDVCQQLRAARIASPVLMLTAMGTVQDRVTGLRCGADDYLTKPFAFEELLARIEALLRRGQGTNATTRLKVGDLDIDLLGRTVTRGGKRIELTTKEFQLLEFLARRQGQVVTRTMLLEGVWDLHFDPQTNVIDVHMSRLRNAVDREFPKPLIHTVRGAGYVLRDEP